jgi:hypothetical protein
MVFSLGYEYFMRNAKITYFNLNEIQKELET